jgi:hypothetical protein
LTFIDRRDDAIKDISSLGDASSVSDNCSRQGGENMDPKAVKHEALRLSPEDRTQLAQKPG